jgi:hypothetical protein
MPDKIYDGEELFKTYCNMGAAKSYLKLRDYANRTMVMPKGKKPSKGVSGVEYSMWKWAFKHPEEAFEHWKEWYFLTHPEENRRPEFSEFLKVIQDKAKNTNVASVRDLRRFCAKYEIPMDYSVNKEDVVQVTRKDHPLFQGLLIVDEVTGDEIDAHYFVPDRVYPEANGREAVFLKLRAREVGVVGKAIV